MPDGLAADEPTVEPATAVGDRAPRPRSACGHVRRRSRRIQPAGLDIDQQVDLVPVGRPRRARSPGGRVARRRPRPDPGLHHRDDPDAARRAGPAAATRPREPRSLRRSRATGRDGHGDGGALAGLDVDPHAPRLDRRGDHGRRRATSRCRRRRRALSTARSDVTVTLRPVDGDPDFRARDRPSAAHPDTSRTAVHDRIASLTARRLDRRPRRGRGPRSRRDLDVSDLAPGPPTSTVTAALRRPASRSSRSVRRRSRSSCQPS